MENNEHMVVTKTSKKAIASLVFNLVWLFGLGSIFAIILGHMARTEVKKKQWKLKRRWTCIRELSGRIYRAFLYGSNDTNIDSNVC